MIVVFGSNGQLASSLKATRLAERSTFIPAVESDFTKDGKLEAVLEALRPRIIVNCAAFTRVDAAEGEREKCNQINAYALGRIGTWASGNDATVIHFSTDYVFSGTNSGAWSEGDLTAPINWYGQTKRDGERNLQATGCHFVTFRTSWLFSEYGTNFVKTIVRMAASQEHLRVVDDQVGCPTYAGDIAAFVDKHLSRIEDRELDGIYHLTNLGTTSWHGLAEYVITRAKSMGFPIKAQRVAPIATAQYPTPAKRPLNSVLNLKKTREAFGETLPPWQGAVDRCLSRLRSGY